MSSGNTAPSPPYTQSPGDQVDEVMKEVALLDAVITALLDLAGGQAGMYYETPSVLTHSLGEVQFRRAKLIKSIEHLKDPSYER